MTRFFSASILASAVFVLTACESGPATAEEREAYQRNQQVLDYENQRQQNEMEYLSDGEVQNPTGLDTEPMDP